MSGSVRGDERPDGNRSVIPSWQQRFNALTWHRPVAVGFALGAVCMVLLAVKLRQWDSFTWATGFVSGLFFTAWFLIRRRRYASAEDMADQLDAIARRRQRNRSRTPQARRRIAIAQIAFGLACLAFVIWLKSH